MLKRIGSCNRCGYCCRTNCQHFSWEALKDIKKGETFKAGLKEGFIKANCAIFYTNITLSYCSPRVRRGFPFSPEQVPKGCGFKFKEVST